MSENIYEWVEITPEDKVALKSEKARSTPSPKLFTLKDDSNNAPGHFCAATREAVIEGATESVEFLRKIGFVKA
jgi:hypothetical protein